MSFVAIGASIAGAAVAAGVGAALAPGAPDQPNLARSSRQAVLADIQTLPGRRQVDMLARLGLAGDYQTGRTTLMSPDAPGLTPEQRELLRTARGEGNVGNLAQTAAQNQARAQGLLVPETRHADFEGLGDADVQGELARRMAETTLNLQRRYGADFVDEARRQQELADPEGTEARELLASEIRRMSETERERPVAGRLSELMMEELQAGRGLTPEVAAQVAEVARRRGDLTVNPETELEEGPAAEERLRQRLGHGLSYQSSGQTPEDIRFRDEQQDLANMAAFLGGRTPQSQFGANRNAQQGAAPVAQGGPLPAGAANAGDFASAGLHNFNAQVANAGNQVSPWFAGLSALTRGAQVAGAAGWQPLRGT